LTELTNLATAQTGYQTSPKQRLPISGAVWRILRPGWLCVDQASYCSVDQLQNRSTHPTKRSVLATIIGTNTVWHKLRARVVPTAWQCPERLVWLGFTVAWPVRTGGRRRRLPGQEIPYIGCGALAGNAVSGPL